MGDNKKEKKKTRKICVLIVLVLLATIFTAGNIYCKREISTWMHDFYNRKNFAFNEKPDRSEFCPIQGIWQLSDLEQNKEATDTVVDPLEHDKYIAYFKNADNTLRWDNIIEWLTNEENVPSYVECDAFAELMLDMTDDDLEKVIELGQIKDSSFSKYKISDPLKKVASLFVIKTSEERRKVLYKKDYDLEEIIRFDDAETRALGFLQTVIEIDHLQGKQVSVEISSEEYRSQHNTDKCFNYMVIPKRIDNLGLYSPIIKVYPRLDGLGLDVTLDDIYIYDYYSLKNIKTSTKIPKGQLKQIMTLLLDIGNENRCMEISGQIVQVTRESCAIAYIADIDFDDELFYLAKAYSAHFQEEIRPEELKEHFFMYDEEFQAYYRWWLRYGEKETMEYRRLIMDEFRKQGTSYDEATPEQREEAAKVVDQKLKEK